MKITDNRVAVVSKSMAAAGSYAAPSDFTEDGTGTMTFVSGYDLNKSKLSKLTYLPDGYHLVMPMPTSATVYINGVRADVTKWVRINKSIDTFYVSQPVRSGDLVQITPYVAPNP